MLDSAGTPFTTTANPDGTITYTLAPDVWGTVHFMYEVQDPSGAAHGALVSLEVASVNDVPLPAPDTVFATEDTELWIDWSTLTANDYDAEFDWLYVSDVSEAYNGTVYIWGGSVVFVPDADFSGTREITMSRTCLAPASPRPLVNHGVSM